MVVLLFWLAFVVLATVYGQKRKLGAGWTLLISIALSPLVGFLAAAISGERKNEKK